MAAVLPWVDDDEASTLQSVQPIRPVRPQRRPGELPPAIESALWRGSELGSTADVVLSSGFPSLDVELPGAGWPCHALTEVLQVQSSVAEWRLLAPAMRQVVAAGRDIVVVGPPKTPHLPGLRHIGLDERRLVWIQANTPAERLWVTEQLVKTNAAGLLVSWLPQARQEQIRRLQICAHHCDGPVFLCRPASAQHEPSAAPLRVQLTYGVDWELRLRILKRKGATFEGELALPSVPGGLDAIITPRLRRPSRLLAARDARETHQASHAVGSPAPRQPSGRRVAAH